MAEELHIPITTDREVIYTSLIPQLKSLTDAEDDFIANCANVLAALKTSFNFLWVGCYFVRHDTLILGPFQGPVACTRIQKGKGVCGQSWERNNTILVPDVDLFPGHIACSSASRSEIVIPLRKKNGAVFGVLDVDSVELNYFLDTDQKYLTLVAALLGDCFIE